MRFVLCLLLIPIACALPKVGLARAGGIGVVHIDVHKLTATDHVAKESVARNARFRTTK